LFRERDEVVAPTIGARAGLDGVLHRLRAMMENLGEGDFSAFTYTSAGVVARNL